MRQARTQNDLLDRLDHKIRARLNPPGALGGNDRTVLPAITR